MSARSVHFALLASIIALSLAAPADGFVKRELVVSGLNKPVYLTAPEGDGRLFILEQQGTIRIYKDGSLLPQPFLDITGKVAAPSGEQGLLGLAFDPDFGANRFFYVHYSDDSGATTIERYEVQSGSPDVADTSSAELVLAYPQPYSNHNGGTIDFGPDGYLYFGFGDGGSGGDPGNRAQDPSTLLGKIIRIDVTPLPYTIPPDNPYAGSGTVENEIWARGVRNPYRWSFDRSTGDMWIGDVGQSQWEEIDFQAAAGDGGYNYGWRLMEGLHCYNPPSNCGADTLDLPIYEYGHTDGNCSIIGGHVYRGAAIPELQGYYVFGDYCSGKIWALRYDGSMVTDVVELTHLLNGDSAISSLSGICEDGSGELYLIDLDGTSNGEVYRIVRDPTQVDEETGDAGFMHLGPASPNPFSDATAMGLFTSRWGATSVRVFDAAGRLVRTVLSTDLAPGTHDVRWDGRDDSGAPLSSGVYFVRAESGNRSVQRKVNLLR